MKSFVYPLRIHIEDTDMTGLVFHANYINFMERARSEWLHQLGYDFKWQQQEGIGFLVHSLTIEYLKPAKLHEEVEVVTELKSHGRANAIFAQYLRLKVDSTKIVCKADIKIVCINQDMKPTPFPESMLLTLRRLKT